MASKSRKQPGPPSTVQERFQQEHLQRFRRFRYIWMLFLAATMILAFRLFELQVARAHVYQQKAKSLRSQSLTLYSRGRILDRNGVILAQDATLFDIYAHRRYFYKTPVFEIAQKLAPLLHRSEESLLTMLNQPYNTVALAKDLPKAQAKQIMALKLPGIEAPRKMIRQYTQGHLASHMLGFVNDDASVSSGVESSALKTLRSPPDLPDMELNGRGDFINVSAVNPKLVVSLPHADDVQLTLDARVQFAAEDALAKGLAKNKAKRGAVIVMNPRNGEILAFAALPDFDPERYFKAPNDALKNWAITDVYPPGSTFKILTVACGLETGVINKYSHLHDTGFVKMDGFTIKNYDYSKHGAPGDIDLVYLFKHSSNVGSLMISQMMDRTEHYNLLRKFGIGSRTGLDVPGESAGIIHKPAKWDPLTHATIGYGYGLASTPIQMASAVAAIANDGVWVTPHVLKNEPKILQRRVLSEETAHTVTALLARSIETAETSTVRLEGYRLAGKTGTSRRPSDKGGYTNQVFTSFAGYFPANDPQVLMMVVVDSPGVGEAWGSTVAGPIFHDIAMQTAGYLGIKPDPTLVAKLPVKKKAT